MERAEIMVVKNSPRIISPRYFFKNEKNHFIGVITNPPVFNKRLELEIVTKTPVKAFFV